jgi:hypothetical protein
LSRKCNRQSAASLNLGALSLGGFFERDIARQLALPMSDEVLYVLLCDNYKKAAQSGPMSIYLPK